MSVYTFEAEPRVVRSKPKFRNDNKETTVKKNPLEMAEESIKAEMDRRRFELRKEQLLAFKKTKNKQTPYELRPAPAPKIEVDLTYFLTEQNLQSSAVDCQDTQTDEWQELDHVYNPTSPNEPYRPQKKGVDIETQIWDDDLFDYDIEVEPILHVLVSKTLEQARLEVDEMAEIETIRRYKEECKERLKLEKEDWDNQVKEELERLNKKNEMLAHEREKRAQQESAIRKLQCVHLSKAYLKGILHNSIESVIASNYWQNEQIEKIHSEFVPAIVKRVQDTRAKNSELKSSIHSILLEGLIEPTKALEPVKKAFEEKIHQKEQLRKIQDPRFRNIRVMFSNLVKPKSSKFGFYIKKTLEAKLDEWENEVKDNYNKYKERYFQQEENIEEVINQYNDQLIPTFLDYTLEITTIPVIGFTVASEPYDYLADQYKRYWPEIYFYAEDGAFVGKSGITDKDSKFDLFLNGVILQREKALKENDDSKLIISLASIPEDITSLILTINEDQLAKNAKDNWYNNARYRILDELVSQSIEYEKMAPIFEKGVKIEAANPDESPEFRTVICGRIYRDVANAKWI